VAGLWAKKAAKSAEQKSEKILIAA
jgi:hypothetical protein